MKKTLSLLKAILSQDMNIFKYKSKSNSKLSKITLPLILFSIVAFSIGVYAYQLAKVLAPHNLTYIVLTIFLGITIILTYIEGVYKATTIIFDSKDSDLLFSLPLKKTTILFTRIFKLIIFQYIFNLMYLLPAYVIYCYFEKPSTIFYPIAIIMIILLPLIPTILACAMGYIFRLLFSRVKQNKIAQAIVSIIFFLFIFYLSSNNQGITDSIIPALVRLNDKIIGFYYPIKLYINLINNPNIIDLIKLIMISIIPFGLFVLLASIYYFKFISSFKNVRVSTKKSNKEIKIKIRRPIAALAYKELKRYFSSSVYMMNTLFGLAILLALTITLCFKGKSGMIDLLSNYQISETISSNVLFYFLILVSGLFTSITSSSISLEGKTINITKSLPVDIKKILKSKILYSYIIELPFMGLSLILYTIVFGPSIIEFIILLALIMVVILLSAIIGLLFNLKYPKLNYTNDTEAVKQSLSVMLSLFTGVVILILSIVLVSILGSFLNIIVVLIINILMLLILVIILYHLLMTKGKIRYQRLNI